MAMNSLVHPTCLVHKHEDEGEKHHPTQTLQYIVLTQISQIVLIRPSILGTRVCPAPAANLLGRLAQSWCRSGSAFGRFRLHCFQHSL